MPEAAIRLAANLLEQVMLKFRSLEPGDHQDIKNWASDAEARKWLAGIGSDEWFRFVERDPSEVVLIAVVKDKAAGVVQGEFASNGSVSIALLLDPSLRGKRYGRMILQAALKQPEFEKASNFAVSIDPKNEASLKCFVSAGFKKAAEPDADGLIGLTCAP